ncbi:MAG: hypothetical protein HY951_15405 [Bacteroidia bacterium]|nr:hypothetical protein [Bacteroidia bacterium]
MCKEKVIVEKPYEGIQNIQEICGKYTKIEDQLKIFLFEKTIIDIKDFIDHEEFRKDAKKVKALWKDILIDCLTVLKLNDLREKISYKTSESNFSLNTIKSVRLFSSYGIDELDKYIDDFVEFESILYGSDANYRDHVNHVIYVWLIGLNILLEKNNYLKFNQDDLLFVVDKFYSGELVNFDTEKKQVNFKESFQEILKKPENKKSFFCTKSEFFSIWSITALCHDLGYPLEKAKNINLNLKKILSHFGNLDIKEFSYNFNIINNFLVEKFLNIVSSKIRREGGPTPEDLTNNHIGQTIVQSKYRDKISKSLEDHKHGVLSGLLLYKTLTYFLETDFSYSNELMSYEDSRQFLIRREVLRAITSHTCPKLYHLDIRNISFLLILADELQEWDRPSFDDMRNRISKTGKYNISIDEIKFDNDEDVVLRVLFQVDNDEDFKKDSSEYTKRIKHKFRFFQHILRSAKDDAKRNFTFRWKYKIKFENESFVYRFRFDSKKDSFEQIKSTNYKLDSNNVIIGAHADFDIYN